MFLTMRQAAELIDVPERTVENWIKKDSLPATRVQGEYRLNQVDLLEWATDRRIKVLPRLFAEEDESLTPRPSLFSALLAGGVHHDLAGTDPLAVLGNVVALLPLPPSMDPEFLLQTLMAREALGTTAVGEGIAIPHVRNPILLTAVPPTVVLCYLAHPVDFKAVDSQPVNTLFTLLTPTVNIHLHLLSRLAWMIRDDAFMVLLRRRASAEEILTAVEEMERGVEGKKR